jgi:hypothetical protein
MLIRSISYVGETGKHIENNEHAHNACRNYSAGFLVEQLVTLGP